MTLKKIKTINIFITFFLCFITHFAYDIFPNTIFSFFFPVNESIWEHIKMMTSTILIWKIIEYFIIKKNNINCKNYTFSLFIMLILSIPIFLIIYYPIYKCTGNNFILNIICLFITIYFINIIDYYLLKRNNSSLNIIGIIGIILLYIAFIILTYNPPKNQIFIDPRFNSYGIPN